MTWIIGIDEAGYGPNLGPFVMSSVACRLPDELAERDLWSLLRPVVRRPAEPDDGRILVGDSKLIYSPARGLGHLEASVVAFHSGSSTNRLLSHYLEDISLTSPPFLRNEPWFTGETPVPVCVEPDRCLELAVRLQTVCQHQRIQRGPIRSAIICPTEFNRIVDRWDSKGAALGHALAQLLQDFFRSDASFEPVLFWIDKHGGRNTYAAMLQEAFPEGVVTANEEGHQKSTYQVHGFPREVRLTFQPRADTEHLCVALASMVSKYVRELLMREFNAFWQKHLPALKPTAGYPGDAARFYTAIRPVMEQLGIAESTMWRKR
jgi:ribonuclease HII